MNCKVEYIEQAYRTVHSEFADALTNAHHSIFNRVKQWNNENPKASFTRKESDDSKIRFTFATNGSAAQKKQAKFVQQLNRENPSNNDVPVIHSVGGDLRVNVLRGTNAYWKRMNTRSSYVEGKDDARGDISSNFVRNVNELGEQFETSPYESYINDKGKITNIRYPIFRDISKTFGTSAKNLQRSARILWKEKDSGNSRGNSEWKNSWLFNDPFLKENEQFTAKEIWEKYQITQDERYTALLGYFFADRLFEKGDDFVGKLFQRGYIVLSSEERPFAADASQLCITRAGIKNILNLTSTYEDFEKAIEVVFTEEVIHHTIDKLMTDEEAEAIYEELSQEEIDKIKTMYDKPNLSKHLVVHEYLRMIVQRKHLGLTSESELYRKILNIVHKLVEYLKDVFKNNSNANVVINRFDEFLKTPYLGGMKELELIQKLTQLNDTTFYPFKAESFEEEKGESNTECFL